MKLKTAMELAFLKASGTEPQPEMPVCRAKENAATQSTRYIYRNFPSSIRPDSELWMVSGQDVDGFSGVLEWCYDERDAMNVKQRMQKHKGQFKNLVAEPFMSNA